MPEHVHLLISEPKGGTPSTVMRVLKQRISRLLRAHPKRAPESQMRLWAEPEGVKPGSLWQRRFYDFNVWSRKKRIEKLAYMHLNPAKRGIVEDPTHWIWSSYSFYQGKGKSLIAIDPMD